MKKNPVLIFLIFLILFSAITFYIYDSRGGYFLYLTAFMWSPGLAAIATLVVTGKNFSSLGWELGKGRYLLQSYLIPIIYVAVAYIIIWTFGFGAFYDAEFVANTATRYGLEGSSATTVILTHIFLTGTFGVVSYVGTVLGEEIGWRGFLVPELAKKNSFIYVGLVSGIIWAAWHFPLFLVGSDIDQEVLGSLLFFTIMVIAVSFILAWLRLASGSLWTAVIMHATHNYFIQRIATPLTTDTGNSSFYIDETGIVLPLVILGFAAWFVYRRPLPSIR